MADALAEIRIVIADDHPTFRDRVKGVLESEPGFAWSARQRTGSQRSMRRGLSCRT
jgi:DNA-binding NarL/FixJ family response regulator